MSHTLASLRKKINNAKELRVVVRTMKAMSAAHIGQYEKAELALENYYAAIELGLVAFFRHARFQSHGQSSQTQSNKFNTTAVIFGSDQGLVGQFNEQVMSYMLANLKEQIQTTAFWAVGERVYWRLKDAGITPQGFFTVPSSVDSITPLIEDILIQTQVPEQQIAHHQVYLFYNSHLTGAIYNATHQRLLPLDKVWQAKLTETVWPTKQVAQRIGGVKTLETLIREYLFVSLFRACAESLASENASRLIAMQRAEKNIDELLVGLNERYHQMHKDNIDAELFDVISGFEAIVE